MSIDTVNTWTCDMCGKVDVQPDTLHPIGWREMRISGWRDSNYVQKIDVCSTCANVSSMKEKIKAWWTKDRLKWK